MANSGVYQILSKADGRRYVGSAVDITKRWKEHRRTLAAGTHHSKFLQRCWQKYGSDAFEFSVIVLCDRATVLLYEQMYLDAWLPEFNTAPTAGSQLGLRMSEQAKAKMSDAAKRTRNFTGHRHSAESKARISAARKGKGGGPRSPERLAKISAALKGRRVPEERRVRIAATLTGRATGRGKLTESQVRGIKALRDQGMRQSEIASSLSIPRKHVHTVVRGHGYAWVN